MKKLFTFVLLLICGNAIAQEISLQSFEMDPYDLEAKLNPVFDANGNPGSMVRVLVPNQDAAFSGDIVGEPIWDGSEWIIHMAEGSESLRIIIPGYAPYTYRFEEDLLPYRVYNISLFLPSLEKIQFLIQPVFSQSVSQDSFGLVMGVVKKRGFYVKATSNFTTLPELSFDCDDAGIANGSTLWLTGKELKNRYSFTGGYLRRVAKPVYIYAGAGYGSRTLAWELYDGDYAKVLSSSYTGFEAEAGIILKLSVVSVSLGIQTNQFRNLETNIGIGLIL